MHALADASLQTVQRPLLRNLTTLLPSRNEAQSSVETGSSLLVLVLLLSDSLLSLEKGLSVLVDLKLSDLAV